MKPLIFAFLLLTYADLMHGQSLTPPFRYYIITDIKSMSNPADSCYYSKDYQSAVKEYQKCLQLILRQILCLILQAVIH